MRGDEHRQSFDLTSLVQARRAEPAGIYNFATFFVIFGLGLFAFGAALLIMRLKTEPVETLVAYGVLAGGGLVVTASAWSLGARRRALPTSLSVSSVGVTLHFGPSKGDRTLRWDDSKLNLTLYDRRHLPRLKQDGTPRSVFDLLPRGGPSVPIPEAAFDAVMSEAKAHNLRVSTERVNGTRSTGTVDIVSIHAA